LLLGTPSEADASTHAVCAQAINSNPLRQSASGQTPEEFQLPRAILPLAESRSKRGIGVRSRIDVRNAE
jgi:hypothetical protein